LEQLTLKPQADATGRPANTFSRTCRVSVADLLEGMYVSELDRPWGDTPFLLAGFLIDDPNELDALRQQCAYVYIDRDLSDPSLTRHLHQLEQRATSTTKSFSQSWTDPAHLPRIPRRTPRQPHPLSAATRQHFRTVLTGSCAPAPLRWSARLAQSFKKLIKRFPGLQATHDEPLLTATLAELIPAETTLAPYATLQTMAAELPNARAALIRCSHAYQSLRAAARSAQPLNRDELTQTLEAVVTSMIANPDAMLWAEALQHKMARHEEHGVRVALSLIVLGRHLGLPRPSLVTLGQIGLVADLGETQLPRALLDKPGMLNSDELRTMRQHVQHSVTLLQRSGDLPDAVARGIAHHHERFDGSGYPQGLRGSDISVMGRMAAIADVFCALITPRAYAHEVSAQEALMNLYEWSGRSFDGALVAAFVQALGVFPVGRLVELGTGEVAAVVRRHPQGLAAPAMVILTTEDKRLRSEPLGFDLAAENAHHEPHARRILRGLPIGAYGVQLPDVQDFDPAILQGVTE
jgi:HD-GYP domain-containing protein (c-di-GMP phosphodiesterase class II)